MSARLEAGWDIARLGAMTFVLDETGGSGSTYSVSLTSGTYCHTGLSSVTGAGTYTSFAVAVQAAMNATASPEAGNYVVTWSPSTYTYNISVTGGGGAMELVFSGSGDAGTRMRRALGFSGDQTGGTPSTGYTSDVRPYYVLDVYLGGWSSDSDDYEDDDASFGAVSENGTIYNISRTEVPVRNDFTVFGESKSQAFGRLATASIPWTYQDFVQHCRGIEPFLRADPYDASVHKIRAPANWQANRVFDSWDGRWSIPLETFMIGYL